MSFVNEFERLLDDGNATETMGEDAAAPSAPITSPTAPMPTAEDSAEAPNAEVPTEDTSPVAAPAMAPTFDEPSPVSAPVSSPIMEDLSPISVPASVPTFDEFSPTFSPPVYSPASFPSRLTDPPFPTTYGGGKADPSMVEEIETFVLNPFHIIVIACVVGVVTLLLFWKCCKSWKLRREKRMLRLQSTRVDAVLGDMQMVGMDEYDDDDPELI